MISAHGRFVWYELSSPDPAASKAFYKSVLGWDTSDASGGGPAYTFFLKGRVPVAGLTFFPESARKMGAAPQWTGYVAVSDVDLAARRVTELNGFVFIPPSNVPNVSRFTVIGDPERATLVLVKGLGQGGGGEPAKPNAAGPVTWHELIAAHPDKAFDFYSALLGWQKANVHQSPLGSYQDFSIGTETVGGI